MIVKVSRNDSGWLEAVLEALPIAGCAIVTDVLDAKFVSETKQAMLRARDAIRADIGEEKLKAAGELGVLRIMLRFEPFFTRLLELPEVLAVVDSTVSPTAILHLQNGIIPPPFREKGQSREHFQTRFHQDFPRVLNGYPASINTFFALDEFRDDNGATLLAPGSHQKMAPKPSDAYFEAAAVPALCPAGSMIVFDSTLWHAAGPNLSPNDRFAINQQFTRSYLKQQIDYPRALGAEFIEALPARTQQLLGWYTRTPTSLDDYYRPQDQRLYRGGQG